MTAKEVGKRPEDEAEEEEEEDSDEERSDTTSTAPPTTSQESTKKKKKKKKKKKGKGASGGSADAAQPTQSAPQPGFTKAQKAELEKRFAAGLDACRGNDEMWVKLPECHIFDAKAKKLAEALKSNSSITIVDLSSNSISDEGAHALASMLSEKGAPSLIQLDLRDNPLTESALQALETVAKTRKLLEIKLGSLQPPEPQLPKPTASAPAAGGKTNGLREVTKGPMFRKYFQTGDDDDEGPAGQAEPEGPLSDGGLAPEELWSEVKALVAAGTESIPRLSHLLQQLIVHLTRELGTLQVPHTDAQVDGSRPHIKGCILNLDTLGAILQLVPRPLALLGGGEPQPAVGSHRVWATEIVSILLAPNHAALDRLVASSRLVSHVLVLSLAHPNASALHTRALRMLRSCCVSKVADLFGPLLAEGMGLGSANGRDGSGKKAGENGVGAEGAEAARCSSLQRQLAERAAPSLGIPSGRRDPSLGFVLEACKVLRACCDEANRDSIFNLNVRRLLQMDPHWCEFVSETGVLAQLLKEQEGDLGGPRAVRLPLEDSSELSELAHVGGGGLISSHEILALLQNMSQLGMTGGGGGH